MHEVDVFVLFCAQEFGYKSPESNVMNNMTENSHR